MHGKLSPVVFAVALAASYAHGQGPAPKPEVDLATECSAIRETIFNAPNDPSMTEEKKTSLRARWRAIGCASFESKAAADERWETVSDMSEGERNQRCAEIHAEIAREQNRLLAAPAVASSWMAGGGVAADVNRKVAVLRGEYAELQCDVLRVVPGTPAAAPVNNGARMSFDECYKKCLELTTRRSEQCFDACNR